MKPQIIVCGLGRTGYKIFSLLRQQGASVVGISNHPIPGEKSDIIIGDSRSATSLLSAGLIEAHTLVIAGDDDALNLAILVQARVLNPKIRIINRLFNTSLGDRLDCTLPEHTTMSVSALAAPVFAFAAQGNQAIGQLRLFNQTWPIHEEYIDSHHPWCNRSISDLWDDRNRMLIYYLPVNSETDLISAVTQKRHLQIGDRLIIATKPSIRNSRKTFFTQFNKLLVSLRQFQQHCQSSIGVAFTLIALIFLATFTYTTINTQNSLVDSLYFSVGMITGAGGKEEVAEKAPDSIKLFTALMMLVGTGVVGICYALLNDWILGTRFRQLLEATPPPGKHHYIVCGLGGVGIQIVNQLHSHGHEVIAIERDPNSRFLSAAYALKIPVIQGDASMATTLEAANITRAEALIAVTSNDTVNLEIALTAKGLAPKIPAIVRSTDPHFARLSQQVFEFDAVLSPIDLAAPSFAAAALGGRILGNGMTADSLWVALATRITNEHPFCSLRIKEAAMSADFVPLYLETNCQTIHGWDLLETCLSAGDVLYLTMPATQLQQLWRATPASELIMS